MEKKSNSKDLQKRSDDTLEIAITRYETFEKKIKPVIDFYKESYPIKDHMILHKYHRRYDSLFFTANIFFRSCGARSSWFCGAGPSALRL